jgi:hypothetical protein
MSKIWILRADDTEPLFYWNKRDAEKAACEWMKSRIEYEVKLYSWKMYLLQNYKGPNLSISDIKSNSTSIAEAKTAFEDIASILNINDFFTIEEVNYGGK